MMPLSFSLSKRNVWMWVAAAALGAAACSEPAPAPPPATPPAKTAEARAQFYKECWDHFNNKAWDRFQLCYAETAVSDSVDGTPPSTTGRAAIIARGQVEAQVFADRRGDVRLMLVNGDRMASVAYYTATHTGPMPGPDGKPIPATNKPVGLFIAHSIELDPTGSHAVRDAAYVEQGTLMAQLGLNPMPSRKAEKATPGPATTVIARNDDTERANLAAARANIDASNKHDIKALEGMTTDDYKLIEIGRPADMDKKAMLAGLKEMFSSFPDVRFTPATMWAAGEYVVIEGSFDGTNTGDIPSMKLKKTGKKVSSRFLEIMKFSGGKVQEDWIFYNGAAFAAQLGLK